MASPLAVVDTRFCVPRTLPLTLTMSLTLGGAVTDASGAAVLRVDAPLFGFLHRFVLAGVAGRPILSIQKKARHACLASLKFSLSGRPAANSGT